jgi:Protein of unknown function (DUF3224)
MTQPSTGAVFEQKFDCTTWEETPQPPREGLCGSPLITRVKSERKFYDGSLEGTGVLEYVFAYHPNAEGPSKYVDYFGHMHFKGTYDGGEPGEIVFKETGHYDGKAYSNLEAIEGSATGGLKGLKISGNYVAGDMKQIPCSFRVLRQ